MLCPILRERPWPRLCTSQEYEETIPVDSNPGPRFGERTDLSKLLGGLFDRGLSEL
jgi:hypothetical protein